MSYRLHVISRAIASPIPTVVKWALARQSDGMIEASATRRLAMTAMQAMSGLLRRVDGSIILPTHRRSCCTYDRGARTGAGARGTADVHRAQRARQYLARRLQKVGCRCACRGRSAVAASPAAARADQYAHRGYVLQSGRIVQEGTAEALAQDLDLPIEEINYQCAGINHMAFYLKFERNGEDLYPRLREIAQKGTFGRRYRNLSDKVRYEVFKRTGHFVTESSEHFSEYVPWFIKHDRPDLIEQYEIPIDEYLTRCELQIAGWENLRAAYERGELEITHERSHEYGSLIIHSMETDTPRVIYGNVPNHGLIDNLPHGCCVEVPCLVNKNGVQPTHVGELPPQLAALMQTNINVQSLAVEAALTRKRAYIYHAVMLDPHTAAELSLDQIWALVDELIEAHGSLLPSYS